IGVVQEGEDNRIVLKSNDTLTKNSFAFNQMKAYINNGDTSQTFFQAEYRKRIDYNAQLNEIKEATEADEASVGVRLQKNPNSRLSISALYRDLKIKDDRIVSSTLSDNTALGRVEYSFKAFKGVIQSNSFYQVGTGQEQKKEFTYVEVPTGQGIYTWTDYNSNGIQELNEFDVANFSDQANFVRVFTPTNEFINTRSNQFNSVVTLNPSALGELNKLKLIKKFNNQFAIRLDNKSVEQDLLDALNPIFTDVKDSSLITANTSIRNTIFFNRTNQVFGIDYTVQEVRNKTELVNGYELRTRKSMILNSRINAGKVITINMKLESGNNVSDSEFFTGRDFDVEYYLIFPKLSFQRGRNFRVSFTYELKEQKNIIGDVGEKATQNDLGVEIKFSSVSKGIITARFNYIDIDYNDSVNTPIAYEILQGLNIGQNLKWNLSVLKNLSKTMQVNLNYDGRDTGGDNIIHTGSVQVRAFF
ncbi:MAG: hypothetical protein HKN22_07895, partial [Bacteroidia bacterium]|nr:hypothetical protein [Bacteroidia bacterium]